MPYKNYLVAKPIVINPLRSFFYSVFPRTLCALLFVLFTVCMHAQKVDTSFTLLWYKGKKISDTSLSKPNGTIITYSPSQQTVTVTYPAGKDPLQSFSNAAASSRQSMISIDEAIAGASANEPPPGLVVAVNEAIERANRDAATVSNNTIKIKAPPPPEYTTEEKVEWLKKWPPDMARNYSAVIAYVTTHKPTALSSSLPPPDWAYDYCFPCDEARKKKYYDDSIAFMKSFLTEEYSYLDRAISVMAWLQIPKLTAGTDSLLNTEARTNVFNAMLIIAKRIEDKIVGTWDLYRTDWAKVPFLVRLMVTASGKQQLFGLSIEKLPSMLHLGAALMFALKETINKAKQDKDYKVLLNSDNLYFSRYADKFGLSAADYGLSVFDMTDLWKFKMDVDANAKIDGKDMMESAELYYKGNFIAYSDTTCRLKWERMDPDTLRDIPFNLIQIAMNAANKIGHYTGTMDYVARPPYIRLDFCDQNRDTADFFPFYPKDPGVDSWTLGRQTGYSAQVVHGVFTAGFINEASLRKRSALMQQYVAEEHALMLELQQLSKSMPADSTKTPEYYKRAAQLKEVQEKLTRAGWYQGPYYFPVRGQLKNFKEIIFDETLDGKQISRYPGLADARFHVKIRWVGDKGK